MSAGRIAPFHKRLGPALKGKGFRQDDYWVWCSSVVRGEDGRYHMFASRWPKKYPFFHGYLAASEVVRASADEAAGPYVFDEVVLPTRGGGFWDGRMTHNPFIVRWRDELLLFYIGATYDGPIPTRDQMDVMRAQKGGTGKGFPWYATIRIGVARSESVFGPWTRPDRPTFDIDPDSWDDTVVTNPSPCIAPDGRILMFYRSTAARLGLAATDSPDEPFERIGTSPAVDLGDGKRIEDPFVFWMEDHYEMVAKDLSGLVTGEFHAAIHLTSPDASAWSVAHEPKAWSRTIAWDDGSTTTQGSIERPFILFEDGAPRYLFAATADGPGPGDGRPGFYFAENTWTMVFELRPTSCTSVAPSSLRCGRHAGC
jgi:hypothetical protein